MSIFEGLNANQAKVVSFDRGRLVVPATAGSGKTRCVVHWIANMVQSGADPESILATTFTKKGAEEMNDRLQSLGVAVGGRNGSKGARVGTYHSLCYDILKDGSPWEHYAFDDKNQMHKVLKQEILSYNKGVGMNWQDADITKVLGFIGHCQNELISPHDARHSADSRFEQAYLLYEEARHDRELLTFDAMLFHACEFFLTDSQARARWSSKYQYVVVDEMQDTNKAQWYLSDVLGESAKVWIVVGDDDQSIYGWRGAHPEQLVAFPQTHNADVIQVDINYRSRPEIIEIANRVIAHNQNRLPKKGVPHREPQDNVVNFHVTSDMDAEARYVYERLLEHREDGRKWGEFTVLYRTNAQSRAFEEVFIQAKVPYYIEGGVDFWKRKEIKDLLAYLKVISDNDDAACRRIINIPFRYIGNKTLDKISDWSNRTGVQFFDAASDALRSIGLHQKQIQNLEHFLSIVRTGRTMAAAGDGLTTILEMVIEETGYYNWVQRDQGSDTSENSRISNIRELLRTLNRFDTSDELFGYLKKLDVEKRRRKKGNADVVKLMSIHKSKGLEFPIVFLAGAVEDILPHHRSVPDMLEEERRLFFVAVTRAMDRLHISAPVTAYVGSQLREMKVSRFVQEAGLVVTNQK